MSVTAVIFGATSAIATAHARILAGRGARLFLVARREGLLEEIATDLRVRGAAGVTTLVRDLDDVAGHAALVAAIVAAAGRIDLVVIAQGALGSQERAEHDPAHVMEILTTNFTAPAALLTEIAVVLVRQGGGTAVVLSSVAGDRGRASNYAYGSAKAGLSAFASGLRQRAWRSGVRIVTVKPGFVDTPMTAAFRKGPLWASPERVARDVDRAVARGAAVVYTPWWWRLVMLPIRMIPERIFARLGG